MDTGLRILTWNVFHCRDGGTGPDGVVHVNRKHMAAMAALLARADADVVMLQEVPPLAIPALARGAGAVRGWAALTSPRIGGRRLRGWLGTTNPDLWRSREGNANVVLMGPRLRPTGEARSLRLNPLREALLATARHGSRSVTELWRWLSEPRRALAVDAALPDGTVVTFACTHLHGARLAWQRDLEMRRLAAWLDGAGGPVVLGADLNTGPVDPAMGHLHRLGIGDPPRDPRVTIDRILVRGLAVVAPERRWMPADRRAPAGTADAAAVVMLSDHDPVEAVVGSATGT